MPSVSSAFTGAFCLLLNHSEDIGGKTVTGT